MKIRQKIIGLAERIRAEVESRKTSNRYLICHIEQLEERIERLERNQVVATMEIDPVTKELRRKHFNSFSGKLTVFPFDVKG